MKGSINDSTNNFTYHILPKPPNTNTAAKRSDTSSGGKGKVQSQKNIKQNCVFYFMVN